MCAMQPQPDQMTEVTALRRYAPISPRKVRLVVDLVRGASVDEAFDILRMTRKRASPMIAKLLKAAVATAGERHDVEAEALYIKRAWVDGGPVRKTWWPRPRGMAARKRHRTSHIHIVLAAFEASEEDES